MLFQDLKNAEWVFGTSVGIYAPVVNNIAEEMLKFSYVFISDESFENGLRSGEISRADQGVIYWSEILQRAQLVSMITLIRTASWVNACSREYEAGSLAGWASCCRSLFEAIGDSADALNFAGITLAEHSSVISKEVAGAGSGAMAISEELENTLIHFTHAREVRKGENVPDFHKAKRTGEYINNVEKMGLEKASEFYGDLCKIMHPAAAGMAYLYAPSKFGFTLSPANERTALDNFISKYRGSLNDFLMLALNPALITIRVACALGVSDTPKVLQSLDLSAIKIWGQIQKSMRSAGLKL